ncbi:MAG: VWA domain-containing protein [Burkholderiales bacterium]
MTTTTPAPLQLVLTPEKPAVASGIINKFNVLARLQAVENTGAVRTPLNLAIVLDRSGSMSGLPLEEAKRCARMIVDGLGPNDRAAIFAFDDEVACCAPLTNGAEKHLLAAAIAGIESAGCTNLHGGWRAGADALRAALAHDGMHRVILLSDGGANRGLTELEEIAQQAKDVAKSGVTTSTYGLGRRFNEDLMLALATAGRGNAYYGQTALDLAEPFEAEFALLSNLCARGVMLKVQTGPDIGVRMLNDYPPVDGESDAWWLPDVAFASEAWAMLEFTVAPEHVAAAGDTFVPAVSITVQAKAQDASPLYLIAGAPSLQVVDLATLNAMPRDALVETRLLELGAARALDAVRAALAAGDLKFAQRMLAEASRVYAEHPWAAAILATMRRLADDGDAAMAVKESRYSARLFNVRLSQKFEPGRDVDLSETVPLYLKRKGSQGTGRRR